MLEKWVPVAKNGRKRVHWWTQLVVLGDSMAQGHRLRHNYADTQSEQMVKVDELAQKSRDQVSTIVFPSVLKLKCHSHHQMERGEMSRAGR